MWGLPLVFLIAATALYFAFLCRLLPFLRLRHSFDLLRGKFSNPADPGEIPHFQALSSALSGTIGMGNIAGVAIAMIGPFIDTTFALMVIPTLTATTLLAPKVVEEMRRYFKELG